MLTVIIGGSGSGKSAFAESKVIEYGNHRRIYIATMEIFDEECRRRVERHQKMRSEKKFETVESPVHLEEVCVDSGSVVLLECMSNLLANEMYSPKGRSVDTVNKILEGVDRINSVAKHMIIVTNDVFGDGVKYDDSTQDYIKKLGEINCSY